MHELRHPADLKLARRALEGEQDARLEFVQRLKCVPAILRSIQRTSSFTQEEVEEVTQHALTAIWTRLDSFDGRAKLETWAYGFCVFELRKWRDRRARTGRMLGGESLEGEASPLTQDDEVKDLGHVREAVDELGPPTSTIIHSKHFEQLTFQEIGERMNLSPNSAKTYYYRGLKKLKSKLQASWNQEQA